MRLAGLEVTVAPSTIHVAKVVGAVVGLSLFGLASLVAGVPALGALGLAVFGLLLGYVAPTVISTARGPTGRTRSGGAFQRRST